MATENASRIATVETNLARELWHLGLRIEWEDSLTAQAVYGNIMDTGMVTSPEIKRLQAEATKKMKAAGLL